MDNSPARHRNTMGPYDYLIVGCGLYGATFAENATKAGKKCLIIDSRDHIGGNCYTKRVDGIDIHRYGAHIFHTNSDIVWEYVNRFTTFNSFINRPKAKFDGKFYSFPINLMTLNQLWGVETPDEAQAKLDEVRIHIEGPSNFEEMALSKVGEELYYTFFYGYTKKQWGDPKKVNASVFSRLPIRMNFDDRYYGDKYQGIPIGGYTEMIQNMLGKTDIVLNVDYFDNREYWNGWAKNLVFTGKIDQFYDYQFGELQYRSLRFETEKYTGDFQGNGVINHTNEQVAYTRTIEHKHFAMSKIASEASTYVTTEYPDTYSVGKIPYYPVVNSISSEAYHKYANLSKRDNIIFGGRLAKFKYMDMDAVIGSVLKHFTHGEAHTIL